MVYTNRRKSERRAQERRNSSKGNSEAERRNSERRTKERRKEKEQLQEALWHNEILIKNIRKILQRRVVITGLGSVAPNGIGKDAFWKGLIEGKNCVDKITVFDPSNHPSQIAAEIKDFDPQNYITSKDVVDMDRSAHLAIAAAMLAREDSHLEINKANSGNIGITMGTGAAGIPYAEKEFCKFFEKGIKKMHPFTTIAGFAGGLSSVIAIKFGVHGPSIVISNGCTGANDAIGYAFNSLRYGNLDVIITGGADACITPAILAAFCRINAVSTNKNHEPKKASRPFNKDRDGFVLSEGAWILILEELNHALKRNAPIYAEIVGYGATCDAYHMTAPLPSCREAANAMKLALEDANILPNEIDYINAHGTSTPLNDKHETIAIKKAFGKHAYSLAVSSLKSMIGHAVGAAGAAGVTASALAIKNGIIPPTINYENPDPDCDLDYVPNKAREQKINIALSNSIGFGSKNSAIVLKKFEI